MENRKLLIFGAGEAGSEILNSVIPGINAVNKEFNWDVIGFADNSAEKIGTVFSGKPVFSIHDADKINSAEDVYGCCSVLDCNLRIKVIKEQILGNKLKLATFIHPTAIIAETASIAEGAIIYPNVIIGDKAEIGYAAIINFSSVIGHDVVLGKHAFLGPNVVLTGRCRVGDNALLGAGVVCVPGVRIGANSKIAAGIVSFMDVEENVTLLLRQSIVKM